MSSELCELSACKPFRIARFGVAAGRGLRDHARRATGACGDGHVWAIAEQLMR
jgi:hypothetical protein